MHQTHSSSEVSAQDRIWVAEVGLGVCQEQRRIMYPDRGGLHSSTAILSEKYRISSELRSQATAGPVSTTVGDHVGIRGAVGSSRSFCRPRVPTGGAEGALLQSVFAAACSSSGSAPFRIFGGHDARGTFNTAK